LRVDCLGGVSVFNMIVRDKKTKKRKISSLAKSLKNAHIHNLFMSNLAHSQVTFNEIDFRIIKCLIEEPRIRISDAAKAISLSQKTTQRRLDRMQSCNLIEFTLLPNPAAIRGYIYFGMVISVKKPQYENIIKYIYSELEEYFFRPPPVVRQEVVILSLYSDNFFDIEKILKCRVTGRSQASRSISSH
jgi:DNA-binding Lrp family transcriptional regulator